MDLWTELPTVGHGYSAYQSMNGEGERQKPKLGTRGAKVKAFIGHTKMARAMSSEIRSSSYPTGI